MMGSECGNGSIAERYMVEVKERCGLVCEPSRTMKGTGHASLLDFCGNFLGHDSEGRLGVVVVSCGCIVGCVVGGRCRGVIGCQSPSCGLV